MKGSATVIVAVLMALGPAACGGDGRDPTGSPDDTAAPDGPAVTDSTPEAEAASDGDPQPDVRSTVPASTAVTTVPSTTASMLASEQLASALESFIPDGSPGVIVRVDAGGETIINAAAGEVAFDSGRPLTPDHPFRLASTTKPITAATVLRLQEEGSLHIDDPVADYLPADLVAQLHVTDGVSRGDQITIRHLLNHSSGLADRPFDTPFGDVVAADPGRVWEPRELVEFGITHAGPLFPPGTDHYYSDDGYVLLGMIIENADGRPLHQAYRELVLDPLEMDDTYLEGHEEPRGLEVSHAYYGEFDVSTVHPSTDWGGGGLVSTVADLTKFGTALLDGALFEQPETLRAMTTDQGHGYGLGLDVRPMRYGSTALIHGGFWGSTLLVIPELDYVLAATINQYIESEHRQDDFVLLVLEVTLSDLGR